MSKFVVPILTLISTKPWVNFLKTLSKERRSANINCTQFGITCTFMSLLIFTISVFRSFVYYRNHPDRYYFKLAGNMCVSSNSKYSHIFKIQRIFRDKNTSRMAPSLAVQLLLFYLKSSTHHFSSSSLTSSYTHPLRVHYDTTIQKLFLIIQCIQNSTQISCILI